MLYRYNNAVDFSRESQNVLEVLAWFKELIYEKGAHLPIGEAGFCSIAFLGDERIWFETTAEAGT